MKCKYEKKITVPLGEYGELVYIWRSNLRNVLLEFSISYRTEVYGKWYTTRRHCWTQHQNRFHTHVRVGLGRKRFKKVYPPPIRGSVREALNWAKRDMVNNWYRYLKNFEKIVKNIDKEANEKEK